jgi:hypothetical protein
VGWFAEYLGGAHVATWSAMVAEGSGVEADGAMHREARAVSDETMRRVRADLEMIVAALVADGYDFAQGDAALAVPAGDASEQLDAAEALIGPIPVSLRSWIEHVGSVDLAGTPPGWELHYSDAIMIHATAASLVQEYEDRMSMERIEPWVRDGFPYPMSPDYFHKANESGGKPYSIWLPDPEADADWLGDDMHETTFVGYLRSSILGWAGFPGWGRTQPGENAPRGLHPRLQSLTRELLAF